MGLYKIAFIELLIGWLFWLYPFVFRAIRSPNRKADVTIPVSKWGMALQGLGYFLVWFRTPGPKADGLLIASMVLCPLAVSGAWSAVRHLGKQWRIQAGLYHDHELVRSGPYRIVRHPIYASMLAIFLATAFVMSSWEMLLLGLLPFLIGTEIRVRAEDRILGDRFQQSFAAYKTSVPAYLPFIR